MRLAWLCSVDVRVAWLFYVRAVEAVGDARSGCGGALIAPGITAFLSFLFFSTLVLSSRSLSRALILLRLDPGCRNVPFLASRLMGLMTFYTSI